MPADAALAIAAACGPALAPPDRLTVDQWADRYRRLGAGSRIPGPWKTDRVPYLREPMRMLSDANTRRVVLKFGTQCAKTEMMINAALYTMDRDPRPIMWVADNADNARDLMRDRLIPAARACPPVAGKLSASNDDTSSAAVRYRGGVLYARGSNSRGNLASKPIGLLLPDEIDKYPDRMSGGKEGRALDIARSRLHSFGAFGREVCASTPTLEGVGIDLEYARSDQRRYAVPCPACGAGQFLRFGAEGAGGVRWDGGVGAELGDVELEALCAEVARTAWYECESCGGRIEQSRKGWMLARGVWVADGQRVEHPKGAPIGRLDVLGAAPATTTRGYWLSQLYSPFRSWGDVAADFVRLRGRVTQDYVNQVLAEVWTEEASGSDQETVAAIVRAIAPLVDEAGVYPKGTVPGRHAVVRRPAHELVAGKPCDAYPAEAIGEAEPRALTGFIDLQHDEAYYEISAWGAMEQRWIVDWGTVLCPTEEVLSRGDRAAMAGSGRPRDVESVRAAVGERWAAVHELVTERVVASAATGEALEILLWGIDSGDRTVEVYHFCDLTGGRCVPTKGADGLAMTAPYDWRPVDRAAEYGVRGDLKLLKFNAGAMKDAVFPRLHQRARGYGAVYWPDVSASSGSLGEFNAFARQLTAEQKVTKATSAGSRRVWELRPGRRDNHYFDCHVGNYALALAGGLRDIGRDAPDTAGPSLRTT